MFRGQKLHCPQWGFAERIGTELPLKIEVVVTMATRIELRSACGTAISAIHVAFDRQLDATGTAQDCRLSPLAPRPHLDRMAGEGDMTILAGVVSSATLHFDGYDIHWLVVVGAAGLRVYFDSTDFSTFLRVESSQRSILQISDLAARVINSSMACCGGFPFSRMANICSVIGISTFFWRAKPVAALVVSTPSATAPCMPAIISGSLRPLPSSTPTLRLRERSPVQVRTKSPSPASPAIVSRRPPQATTRRAISASPRVIRAATELWPKLRPSQTPAAMAITFLRAPPNSTPITSSLV